MHATTIDVSYRMMTLAVVFTTLIIQRLEGRINYLWGEGGHKDFYFLQEKKGDPPLFAVQNTKYPPYLSSKK